MKTWIDFDGALSYAIPTVDGRGSCEGMLIEGPQGWGEFSPPEGCDDRRAARWLTAAIEVGTVGWPDPLRGRVPIAVTVAAVRPEQARQQVLVSGCRTAAVRVGTAGTSQADDIERLAAVRDALGPDGAIRCDAGGGWDVETAVAVLGVLDRAAGGLEFAQDPCATPAENAAVRRRVAVRIGIGRGLRDSADPRTVDISAAADLVVLGAAGLGGVRRALRIAELAGVPCVVSAEPRSSIAIAGELALAGALPDGGFAHELGGVTHLDGDIVSQARSLIPVDGWLPVAPMPPAPDPDRLAKFTLRAPDRVSRWRERLRAAQLYI